MSNYLKRGEPLPQALQTLIQNNVRAYEQAPYSYVVYQNKHIPNAIPALYNKLKAIQAFAERNMGYVKVGGKDMREFQQYLLPQHVKIRGDFREVVIEMNCACVAAKAFDSLISK